MTKMKPFERAFFGRKRVLDWVDNWLQKCEDRGIVLGIFGIGGVGKTAILHQLRKQHKYTIYVDCIKDDMMTLMNTISTRARHIGFKTPRFNRLRDIRLWFLEGVQPAKPASKGWIKDLVVWIPKINALVKVATAISTAGTKLAQLITKYYGDIEQWFIDTLGSDYGTTILELLIRDPEQTSNLFLESLVADLNSAVMKEDLPLLILMDSFEYVNADHYDEAPYPGLKMKLSQAEKWYIFLSRIRSGVGIISGRSLPHVPKKLSIQRFDKEITELGQKSCKKLLESRGIVKPEIVQTIMKVSHRNPFVINTICDVWERGDLNLEEILELGSDVLLEVRERTWSLLFSKAKEIWTFIESAALVPFFDFQIMSYIDLGFNHVNWKELTRLSCVQYDDPYWTLHDLARELVLAEQGEEVAKKGQLIRHNLGEAFTKTRDPVFLGLSLSATNHISEELAFSEMLRIVNVLGESRNYLDLISALEAYEPASITGQGMIQYHQGICLLDLNRLGEARLVLTDAIESFKEFENSEKQMGRLRIGQTKEMLGITYMRMGDNGKAEDCFVSALEIFESLEKEYPEEYLQIFMRFLGNIGSFYIGTERMSIGEDYLLRALRISDALDMRESKDLKVRIVILIALGNLYKDTNRIKEAETTYIQAIDDAEKSSGVLADVLIELLCKIHNNLGLLYFNVDDLEKTREHYDKSMKLSSELEKIRPDLHQQFIPDLLSNMGLLDALEMDFLQAVVNYDKALLLYRELAMENPGFYSKDIAMVQFNRGLAFRELDNPKESISAFEESRSIYSKLRESEPTLYAPRLANVCSHLGVTYLIVERFNDSEKVLNGSLDIFENLDSEILELHLDGYAFALNHKGVLQHRQGEFKEALRNFRKALSFFEQISKSNPSGYIIYQAMVLSNISAVFISEGNGDKAEDYALRALRIYSRFIEKRLLVFLGIGMKVILNIFGLYKEVMKLSSDEAKTRLEDRLESIIGKKMTKGILVALSEE